MTKPPHYLIESIGFRDATASGTEKVVPREFLAWAEKDLASPGARGRGNALSNVKKALHARLDELISRTHVPFTNDWKPRLVTTDLKLEITRELGVGHEGIVDLITAIRNNYEHGYIVPTFREIKAYLNAAQLWVEKTYEAYDAPFLGVVNLPLQGIGRGPRKANGSVITNASFGKPEKVLCFINSRKVVLTILKDGRSEERAFRSFEAKEMLRLEAPYIKRLRSGTSSLTLDEASLQDLLERYRLWLKKTLAKGVQQGAPANAGSTNAPPASVN